MLPKLLAGDGVRGGVGDGAGLAGAVAADFGAEALAFLPFGVAGLRAVLRAGFFAALRAVVFLALVFLAVVLRALARFLVVLRAPALRGAAFLALTRFTLLRAGAFLLVVRFFPLFFAAMALLRS